ncbi:MAG: sterol desaturase family protein [Candidatus Latescibacteria bacterium]|jgi:sterol desaturase/sphingolipid hydroxylase (fatty acid hydroxylase superfamily)|nr:sterol desaturase family protein [Candidatus Latescibacterota bacterium]MBT4141352.1 sterol desaturase family protein [Candidatus Latescibacterota bacterium]
MLIEKMEKDILLISLLVIFYIWECLYPYFGTFEKKTRHAVRNMGLIALNAVVVNLLLLPLVVFATNTTWGVFRVVSLDGWMELVLTIAIIDLLTYFMHVIFHRFAFLWRFHRMHHSDPEMDVTTGARFHIGEHIISVSVRCAVYAVFAIKIEYLLFYEALFLANVLFHHANISIGEPVDKLYRIFLTSPNMHKVHHSDIQVETDSNYTSLFSIWDRIFGTFRIIENPNNITYGVKGLESEQTIKKMLMTPLKSIDAQ